jgi:hypothetical protein
VVALASFACGPFGGTRTAASPSPTATQTTSQTGSTTSKQLLFAVVESKERDGRLPVEPNVASTYDTVAIVGLDGFARAKASFTARSIPSIGNAAPVMPAPAQVAAGAVFYADRSGVVRKLTIDGTTSTVATFPVTDSQQELAFAVSPDGEHLVATVLTFPKVNPKSTGPVNNFLPPIEFKVTLEKEDAGGSTETLWTKTYPRVDNIPMVAGWDSTGPVVMTQALTGTQNPTNFRPLFVPLRRLNRSDGSFGSFVGGTGCDAWSELRDATTLCVPMFRASAQVRSGSGSVLWSPALGNDMPSGDALSPDGGSVVAGGLTAAPSRASFVVNKAGTKTQLGAPFLPEGWLDNQTLIGNKTDLSKQSPSGAAPPGNLALVRMSDPTTFEDLGFLGAFVGVVQAP